MVAVSVRLAGIGCRMKAGGVSAGKRERGERCAEEVWSG